MRTLTDDTKWAKLILNEFSTGISHVIAHTCLRLKIYLKIKCKFAK